MTEIVMKVDGEVLPTEYNLTYKELQELYKSATIDFGAALGTAFKYGFALGKRAYKNGRKKVV